MPTGTGGHSDQAIHSGFGGFLGMAPGGDVVEHQAAVAVHRIDQFFDCAEAGDHDRYFVFDANLQIRL
ncbi:hypothetical protein D3C85_1503010 [compost metagenome]